MNSKIFISPEIHRSLRQIILFRGPQVAHPCLRDIEMHRLSKIESGLAEQAEISKSNLCEPVQIP